MNAALRAEPGCEIPRGSRRCPRFSVSWPVVVEVGKRFFLRQAVNVSGRGARVRPTERLSEGSVARLHFRPPTGPSLDVEAIVWRADPDGLSFLFTDDSQSRLTTLLVQLGGTPPAPWAAATLT